MAAAESNRAVFVSYARGVRRREAEALHAALGELAFLDADDLERGEVFPRPLFDAVARARVFVMFADPEYFQRWYCLRELRIARARYDAAGTSRDSAVDIALLRPIIVVLPPGAGSSVLDFLPTPLRGINWPDADDLDGIAKLVHERLAELDTPLLPESASSGGLTSGLAEEAALPPPGNLGAIKFYSMDPFPPSIGAGFVGRASLLERVFFEVATARGGLGAAALSASLRGTGGIGKTRAAIELVWRYGPKHFTGGVFWINAAIPERRERQFHGALTKLDPSTPSLDELRRNNVSVADLLRDALATASSLGPILWLIDNLPEPEPGTAPEPLASWCPGLGSVAVVITTRLRLLDPSVTPIEVQPLVRDASIRLLSRDLSTASLSWNDAYKLSEWVGDLPLALEILNRSLALAIVPVSQVVSMAAAARDQSSEVDRLHDALTPYLPPGALPGVVATLRMSADRLPPEARRLATVLAHLAPLPIPELLITALREHAPPTARAALVARSIVIAHGGETFASMHRVVADFFRSLPVADGQQAPVETAKGAMLTILPDSLTEKSPGAAIDALLGHGAALLDRNGSISADDVSLAHKLVVLAVLERRTREGVALARRAVELSRACFGDEDRRTLQARHELALALWQQRSPSLRDELAHLFADLVRLVGETADITLESRYLLGMVEKHDGSPDRALGHFDAVHNAYASSRRAGHPLSLRSYVAALRIRADAGELSHALIEAWVRQLTVTDLPSTATAVEILTEAGHLLAIAGAHTRAAEVRERALAFATSTLGPESEAALRCMLELAETLFVLEEHQRARALEERVYAIRERIFGATHPDTLLAANNLALTLTHLGEEDAACRMLERVVEGQSEALGSAHPETLRSKYNLASAYGRTERVREAVELLRDVLEGRRARLGAKNPETFSAEITFRWLVTRDDPRRGLEELRDVQKRCSEALGDEHRMTLAAKERLANQLWLAGELHEAADLLTDIVAAKRHAAPVAPDTYDSLETCAWLMRDLGESNAASEMLRDFADAASAALGQAHALVQRAQATAKTIEGGPEGRPDDANAHFWNENLARIPAHLKPAIVEAHQSGARYLVLDEPENLLATPSTAMIDRWLASATDGGSFRVLSLVPSEDDFARYYRFTSVEHVDGEPSEDETSNIEIAIRALGFAPPAFTGAVEMHRTILKAWLERIGDLNGIAAAILATDASADECSALVVGPDDLVWLRFVGAGAEPTIAEHRRLARPLLLHNPYVLAARRAGRPLRALLTICVCADEIGQDYIAIDPIIRGEAQLPPLFAPSRTLVEDFTSRTRAKNGGSR